MIDINEDSITGAVIKLNAGTADARLAELMIALVQHLHAFVRQTHPTIAEWEAGLEFLSEMGRLSTQDRPEFRLLSDALGVSSLVHLVNLDGRRREASFTPPAIADHFELASWPAIPGESEGEPCFVSGVVRDSDSLPIPGAEVLVLPVDARNLVGPADWLAPLGRTQCDGKGRFGFRVAAAQSVAVPDDGPVGRMLKALNRHPWRAAHLHLLVRARGFAPLDTRIFRKDCPYLDSDALFGVRTSEVAEWVPRAPGRAPDGTEVTQTFYTVRRDFKLSRADGTSR